MRPKVSIIMRVYNEDVFFLQQAIDSVLMQKRNFSIELLLAWDNGTKSTLDLCKRYVKNYPDIAVLLERKKSMGGPPNFFDAVCHAKGVYISCLDADDYWTDSFQLQKEVDFLDMNPEYAIVYADSIIKDEDGNIVSLTEVGKERCCDFSQQDLLEGKHISNRTMMLRNIIDYKNIDTNFEGNEDSFACALIGQYGKGHFMNTITPPVYRIRSGSIWTTIGEAKKIKIFMGTLLALCKYFKSINRFDMADFYKEKYILYSKKLMYQSCKEKNKKLAFKALCISIRMFSQNSYLYNVSLSLKSFLKIALI